MNKLIIDEAIHNIKNKTLPNTSHLNVLSAEAGEVYSFYKYSDCSDDDSIECVIRNIENENHAVVFTSGFVLFSAFFEENDDFSELTEFTGQSFETLLGLLNKKFDEESFDAGNPYLN